MVGRELIHRRFYLSKTKLREIKVFQKCCQIVTSRKTRKRKALKKIVNLYGVKKVVKQN